MAGGGPATQSALTPDAEFVAAFRQFVEDHYSKEIEEMLAQPDHTTHYPLNINTLDLSDRLPHKCNLLFKYPDRVLPLFDEAIKEAATQTYETHEDKDSMTWKPHIHTRLSNLPICPELTRTLLPRSNDVGKFLSITGTVIRATTVKTLEYERLFSCKKCGHTWAVQADTEQHNAISVPVRCPANPAFTGAGDPGDGACDSIKFSLEEGAQMVCRDYQEVKVQERVSELAVGTIPRSLWVLLHDDLVEACQAGDDVIVCGQVIRRWMPLKADIRSDLDTVILANHIKVINARHQGLAITPELKAEFAAFWAENASTPFVGRNKILASVCPQVYGLYVVKLAVLMVLVGGVPRRTEGGTRIRGESHMLLVGDPGTGKSQFLKYAAKLITRSVITTGIGSTSAGLTVSAVKDGGAWTLEAGALVLADGGVCCIDEFNGIREHDRGSIHEAMEQQTLSVAKAGLVCKLNTRTTILAATNPKGQYDPDQSISVNVALASPLLSRFDLILVLLDTHNAEWDELVSSFILEQRDLPLHEGDGAIWNLEKLQAYVQYIKTKNPGLCKASEEILSVYYRMQRQADSRHSARTTIRLLESLVRLAQAHARLMFRDEVAVQDAVVAVTMMESSMQGAALLGASSPLHSAFPANADVEYTTQERLVLTKLGLEHLRTTVDDDAGDATSVGPIGGNDATHGDAVTSVGGDASDAQPPARGASSWAWAGPGNRNRTATAQSTSAASAESATTTSATSARTPPAQFGRFGRRATDEDVSSTQTSWDPIRQTKRARTDAAQPKAVDPQSDEIADDMDIGDSQGTAELFSEPGEEVVIRGGASSQDSGTLPRESVRSAVPVASVRASGSAIEIGEAPWQSINLRGPSRPRSSTNGSSLCLQGSSGTGPVIPPIASGGIAATDEPTSARAVGSGPPTSTATPNVSMWSGGVRGSPSSAGPASAFPTTINSGRTSSSSSAVGEMGKSRKTDIASQAADLIAMGDDDDVDFPAPDEASDDPTALPFDELVKRASDDANAVLKGDGCPSQSQSGSDVTAPRPSTRKRRTFADDDDDDDD